MKELHEILAEKEVGWWQAHHRKNWPDVIENMAREYQVQFNLPYDKALTAVKLRVDAGKEHDLAERFEDAGQQVKADEHWTKTKGLLVEHYKTVVDFRSFKTDVALGTACQYASFTAAGAGLYLITDPKEHFGIVGRIVGGALFASAVPLFNLGCYFFTKPSRRAQWTDAHPWIPKRMVDYFRNRSLAKFNV